MSYIAKPIIARNNYGNINIIMFFNVFATVSTSVATPVPILNTLPLMPGSVNPSIVASMISSIYTKSRVSFPSSNMFIPLPFLMRVEEYGEYARVWITQRLSGTVYILITE